MGSRARARREAAERAERERAEADHAEFLRREKESYRDVFDAGPPGGCRTCYVWTRHPLGGWVWDHSPPDDLIDYQQVNDEFGTYDTRICRDTCHGPDGEDIGPVIAYAAAT